jgi:hypothetical protein
MKKWVFLAIITTVVSLFATSDAFAFGRRCGGRFVSRSCCYTPCYTPCYTNYCAPVVAVPVFAYPVLVPAFQFQYVPQAYATIPVVPVAGYPVATPIVQPVGYGAPPVNGIGHTPLTYQQQAMAAAAASGQYGQPNGNGNGGNGNGYGLNNKDKIRELAKALLEEMNRMSNDGPVDSGPPVVPGTQPQYPQVPQQPVGQNSFFPPPQQPQPNANLTRFAIAAMQRTCAQCHTGVGSKGDMVLFTQPGLINQQANWKKIKEEVASGRMPPKDVHFQLAPQERQGITEWLRSIGVN